MTDEHGADSTTRRDAERRAGTGTDTAPTTVSQSSRAVPDRSTPLTDWPPIAARSQPHRASCRTLTATLWAARRRTLRND